MKTVRFKQNICFLAFVVAGLLASCATGVQQSQSGTSAKDSEQGVIQFQEIEPCDLQEADFQRVAEQGRRIIAAIPASDIPKDIDKREIDNGDYYGCNYFTEHKYDDKGNDLASVDMWLFPRSDKKTLAVLVTSELDALGHEKQTVRSYIFDPTDKSLVEAGNPFKFDQSELFDDFTSNAISALAKDKMKAINTYMFTPEMDDCIGIQLKATDLDGEEYLPIVPFKWDGGRFVKTGKPYVMLFSGENGVPPVRLGEKLDANALGEYMLNEVKVDGMEGRKQYQIAKPGGEPILAVLTNEEGVVTLIEIISSRFDYCGFRVGEDLVATISTFFEEWNQDEIWVSRMKESYFIGTHEVGLTVNLNDVKTDIPLDETVPYKSVEFVDDATIETVLLSSGEG